MAEPEPNRPSSAAAAAATSASAQSTVPPSPKPSVASRTSRSSLQRDRQDALAAGSSPSPQPAVVPEPDTTERTEPSFSPFFALLSSTQHPAQRMTTHHPTMHYIFADDDPEILTDALNHHHRALEATGHVSEPAAAQDRALVLDVAPDNEGGFEVAWASSLSSDWAVVDARVTPMEGDASAPPTGRDSPPGALMLRVDGITIGPTPIAATGKASLPDADTQPATSASGAKHPQKDDYSSLIEDFEKRMGVLRRVLQAGEVRQRIPLGEEDADGPSTDPIGLDPEVDGDGSRLSGTG